MLCPRCGTNNPEGSAHCFSCGGDMDPVARLMNSFDYRKLTPEHRMRCYPVSARINHVANDDQECSAPMDLAQVQNRLFS